MNFKIQRTIMEEITLEQIDNLLICAFEGGSNYWYTIKREIEPTVTLYKTIDYLMPALNPGGALIIVDKNEDEDEAEEYTLNLESIEKGLRLMAESYTFHTKNFIDGNEDAETGDVFLQLCLFGEIVFG